MSGSVRRKTTRHGTTYLLRASGLPSSKQRSRRRDAAMHGKQFLLDALYCGIDETNLYGRVDFIGGPPQQELELKLHFSTDASAHAFHLHASLAAGSVLSWRLAKVAVGKEEPLT